MKETENKNQFECKPGETVTFDFEFENTRFLVVGTFVGTPPAHPGSVDPSTHKLSFVVEKFTQLQVVYQFNGDAGGVYTTTVSGSASGSFSQRIRQPLEDANAHAPLPALYTFNPVT